MSSVTPGSWMVPASKKGHVDAQFGHLEAPVRLGHVDRLGREVEDRLKLAPGEDLALARLAAEGLRAGRLRDQILVDRLPKEIVRLVGRVHDREALRVTHARAK